MINKNILFRGNINSKDFSRKSLSYYTKKFNTIFSNIKKDIKNSSKTLNVLDKKFKMNFKIKELSQFKKFKNIAIIGMGGSILGTEAIYNLFQFKVKKKIYFFNDLDENKLSNLKKKEKISKVLFIIISKSGTTIETLSNLFALNIIKQNAKNIIIISEKNNNLLFSISKKFNLFFIEHKKNIGGRYSVLSEVGLVPAFIMGLNISKLRSKLLGYLERKNKKFLEKNSIKMAQLINSNKYNNLIFLNYSPEVEKFCYWCQQLIAESLGKKNKGFLPVISNAPKDHHSLLQLYLDGPKDKVFFIFSLEQESKEKININKNINKKNFLNKKKLGAIKNAQRQALMKSLNIKGIPYREFKIHSAKEDVLGQLFSLFILETIIIGKLVGINPFDQPAVEQVKVFTKKILT